MAGNKKTKRVSGNTTRHLQSKGRSIIPTLNWEDWDAERKAMFALKVKAISALNNLAEDKGKMIDWMDVHHQLKTAEKVLTTRFTSDVDVKEIFEPAFNAMTVVSIRAHTQGVLEISGEEWFYVKSALDMFHDMFVLVLPKELMADMRAVSAEYETFMAENIAIDKKIKLSIVQTLAEEYNQVKDIPVECDSFPETVELKEAA